MTNLFSAIKNTIIPSVHAQVVGITNPLGPRITNISDLIIKIIQFLLGLVGVLALLALIIGGISYILAFGNDQKLQKAKQIITWAVVGLGVVLLSGFILWTVNILLRG